MPTTEVVLPVQIRIVGRAVLGSEIGLQVRGSCRESAADDLLHSAGVQIDTRTKLGLCCRHFFYAFIAIVERGGLGR